MTFTYSYKDSQGKRHDGRIDAPSRDEAFAILRKSGIRPIRVEADGRRNAEANNGGRWLRMAVVVLGALCLILAGRLWRETRDQKGHVTGRSSVGGETITERNGRDTRAEVVATDTLQGKNGSGMGSINGRRIETATVEVPFGGRVAKPRARKPIPGFELSSRRVEKQFTEIFNHPSEAFLARFAQPGLAIPLLPDADVVEMLEDDMQDALDDQLAVLPDDTRETADLKRIVAGIKEEVALLLTSGKKPLEVKNWLEGRQQMEADYRRQVVRRFEEGGLTRDEANGQLESMGFAPLPDER